MTPEELKNHLGELLVLHRITTNRLLKKRVDHPESIILMDVKNIYGTDMKEIVFKHTAKGSMMTMESIYMDKDGKSSNPDARIKYYIDNK